MFSSVDDIDPLSIRICRAVDNQIFVAACSPARDMSASYHAWGHSTIVNPRQVDEMMNEKPN